jgi:hypothetical protein
VLQSCTLSQPNKELYDIVDDQLRALQRIRFQREQQTGWIKVVGKLGRVGSTVPLLRRTYLVRDPGLVVRPLPAPVPDDEQAQRPVVLGRGVLYPGQLRGGRRAQERRRNCQDDGEEHGACDGSAPRHGRPAGT